MRACLGQVICDHLREQTRGRCQLPVSEGQMLWLKKRPPSSSIPPCCCLSAPEDWGFVPSVTNIPWKRQWLRELLMSQDKQGAPLGLEASLEGVEQSGGLVECGCSPKQCGSIDSQEGWLRPGDW